MQITGRSILAYFQDRNRAEQAVQALKSAGFSADDMQLDRINGYPGDGTEGVPYTLAAGEISSLADLTLGTTVGSQSQGILLAAAPEVSGMAQASGAMPAAWLVAMVVEDDERADQAMQVLEQHGAIL